MKQFEKQSSSSDNERSDIDHSSLGLDSDDESDSISYNVHGCRPKKNSIDIQKFVLTIS